MRGHSDDSIHVAGCADCQARLGLGGLDVDLDRVWARVSHRVWAREVGRLELFAGRLLGSPGLARALLTTPSLVLSWILASAVVLGVGVFFTNASETPWVALLSPALAGIGIAYAYGPGVDPAWELSQTMVVSDRMVLLVRALAVFAVNGLLGVAASLLTDQAWGLTLGWLVPGTTVAALALAAATWARNANAGVAAALTGWAFVVLLSAQSGSSGRYGDLGAAVGTAGLLPIYAAMTVMLLAMVVYGTGSARMEGPRWR